MDTLLWVALLAAAGWAIYYILFSSRKKEDTGKLYAEALERLLSGDKEGAFTRLKQIVTLDSNHIGAYIRLGDIQRENQKPMQAVKIHHSLTVRPRLSHSQQVEIHAALARDYFALKQWERAEEHAGRVLKLDKKNLWALEFLSSVSEERGKWDDALQHLESSEKLTGKKDSRRAAFYILMQGRKVEAGGDDAAAEKIYLQALESDPTLFEAYIRLAEISEKSERENQAVEHLMQCIANCTNIERAVFVKLEKLLFKLGRYSEVEQMYARILETQPGRFDAVLGLANILQAKGEFARALSLVEEVVARDDRAIHPRLLKVKIALRQDGHDALAGEVDQMLASLPPMRDAYASS